MRDLDAIDSELRLLAAVRRTVIADGGTAPSLRLIDQLLDERAALSAAPAAGRAPLR
ncbi:hypothetical protein ACRU13_12235 [Mycobacterium colombiense]